MIQIEMDPSPASLSPDVHLLTPEGASRVLHVPKQTLAVWRCTKRVPIPYIKMGRHIRYRMADLSTFIKSNVVEADQ